MYYILYCIQCTVYCVCYVVPSCPPTVSYYCLQKLSPPDPILDRAVSLSYFFLCSNLSVRKFSLGLPSVAYCTYYVIRNPSTVYNNTKITKMIGNNNITERLLFYFHQLPLM